MTGKHMDRFVAKQYRRYQKAHPGTRPSEVYRAIIFDEPWKSEWAAKHEAPPIKPLVEEPVLNTKTDPEPTP